ncbi:MAG: hypothetical protein JWO38_8193 [Gemmataceae bacterium]|nr:hypothetical protein [Gemmataceae bacterium]
MSRGNGKVIWGIARDLIVSLYAGMPAERLVDPDPPEVHGGQDESDAMVLSVKYNVLPGGCWVSDDTHKEYLNDLRRVAYRLVGMYCEVVQALANELVERKELDREEIEEFVLPLLEGRELDRTEFRPLTARRPPRRRRRGFPERGRR